MTLRIILLIIGVLVILVIAFDGWRRKRQRQKAILRGTLDTANVLATQDNSQVTLLPALNSRELHIAQVDEKQASNQALAVSKPVTIQSANEAIPKKDATKKRITITPVVSNVITLTVMSTDTQPFAGYDVIKALEENLMHFGAYDIYHRHKYKNGKGPLYFSVASVIRPGSLDPKSVAALSTPGLALFMNMDNPKHDRIIFKQMLATAHELAAVLGGVVCDDKRIPLREATLKYYSEKLKL